MNNAYIIDFLITSANYLGVRKTAVQRQIQDKLFPFYLTQSQPKLVLPHYKSLKLHQHELCTDLVSARSAPGG